MANVKKPNTICRNPNCTHGLDGNRKHFYACMSCLRRENWRAYCCCLECYEEYTRIILDGRAKSRAEKLPERTDMTVEQIEEVFAQPIEAVNEYTNTVELADYVEENPDSSLSEIIEQVNADIDDAARKKRKNKSK